jgi:hypothetical protein
MYLGGFWLEGWQLEMCIGTEEEENRVEIIFCSSLLFHIYANRTGVLSLHLSFLPVFSSDDDVE